MSTYVFVGPTISEDQILSIIPGVNILPPIQRGDLIRLRPHQGDVVLIIDGYFGTKPSIQHMEVIHAIGKGCVVIGCSSMGALRASEMDKVGMIGVGEIYDMYRTGVIDGDDEVAVLHDEENYRTYSEPLVNIRVNLDRAVDKGLLSRELKGKLISNMKRRWFGERTYETLINECRKLPDVNAEDLERFLDLQAIDLKKLDSIRAISLIAETSQWRMPIIQFPLTSFAYHLVQEFNIAGKNKSGHSFTVDDVLNLVRLLFDDFKEAYQEVCVQYHMGQEAVVTDDFFLSPHATSGSPAH
ncbi:TfuA-like protein [Ferroacidibacillus organovorans]|uniref:TfuA-like core domain-containing protein n=1 Tax=Ferroacidibacillus organovorans TaxID=1765683 RepID=A0A101XNX9_9BACL|nr:TfuA-like protein [Ferroacidibacillus organovorans]KUO94920.1 hypothetical protein ATW55_15465 [Ferroacidibacillus organovorans]